MKVLKCVMNCYAEGMNGVKTARRGWKNVFEKASSTINLLVTFGLRRAGLIGLYIVTMWLAINKKSISKTFSLEIDFQINPVALSVYATTLKQPRSNQISKGLKRILYFHR